MYLGCIYHFRDWIFDLVIALRLQTINFVLTLSSGVGSSMSQVIAGRAITGIGGGGMMTMASIVITGMYINVLSKSC